MMRVSIGQIVTAIAALGGRMKVPLDPKLNEVPEALVQMLGQRGGYARPATRAWASNGPYFRRKAKRYRGGRYVTRTRHFRMKPANARENYMNAGLRLYALRVVATQEIARRDDGAPYYFTSKRRAKTARNQVSAATGVKMAVILGPDHKRSDPRRNYD